MKYILVFILFSFFPFLLFAQDTISNKERNILKIDVLGPSYSLIEASSGISIGCSFERYRNSKTSYNFYSDFVHYKTTNILGKNVYSIRFLYKRYLFNNYKIKGFYIAGGVNLAINDIKSYNRININEVIEFVNNTYAGFGTGIGYQLIVKDKIAFEVSNHYAFNEIAINYKGTFSYKPTVISFFNFYIGYFID